MTFSVYIISTFYIVSNQQTKSICRSRNNAVLKLKTKPTWVAPTMPR